MCEQVVATPTPVAIAQPTTPPPPPVTGLKLPTAAAILGGLMLISLGLAFVF